MVSVPSFFFQILLDVDPLRISIELSDTGIQVLINPVVEINHQDCPA